GNEFTSRIEARKSENVKYGEVGEFYFNIKRAHIFDIETEENITL
ncbi:sugar ABC transporter ATP-binding protein, partial [Fusobacterium mortiferum]